MVLGMVLTAITACTQMLRLAITGYRTGIVRTGFGATARSQQPALFAVLLCLQALVVPLFMVALVIIFWAIARPLLSISSRGFLG
jgi:hypothetical protein